MKNLLVKFVLIPCLTSLTLSTISLSVFMFTPFPLRQMSGRMAAAGLKLEGIQGCLYWGYQFDKVTFDADGQNFVLDGFEFKYPGIHTLWTSDVWSIESIQVKKAIFSTEKALPALVGSVVGAPEQPMNKDQVPTPAAKKESDDFSRAIVKWLLPKPPRQVALNNIHFTDIEFTESGKMKFRLEEYLIKTLVYDLSEKKLSVAESKFETNLFKFKMNQASFENKKLNLGTGLELALKKGFNGLVKPMSVNIAGNMDFKTYDGVFEVTGLENKLLGKIEPKGSYSIELKGLDLSEYFNIDYPIKRISFRSNGISLMAAMMGLELQGDLTIGDTVFKIMSQDEFKNWHDGYKIVFSKKDPGSIDRGLNFVWIDPMSRDPNVIHVNPIGMLLVGEKLKDAYNFLELKDGDRERLANIFGRKKFADLSPELANKVALAEPFLFKALPMANSGAVAAERWMFWQGGNRVAVYNRRTGAVIETLTLDWPEAIEAVAFNSRAKSFYLKTAKGIVDLAQKQVIGPTPPIAKAFSGSRTMTFDSGQNRIVLVGGEDGSQLITLDLETKAWKLLEVLPLSGVREIQYDEDSNRYWMIRQAKGQNFITDIMIYRNDLKPERRQELGKKQKIPADFGNANLAIFNGNHLMVQTVPIKTQRSPASTSQSGIFLIDLRTGNPTSISK